MNQKGYARPNSVGTEPLTIRIPAELAQFLRGRAESNFRTIGQEIAAILTKVKAEDDEAERKAYQLSQADVEEIEASTSKRPKRK